MNPPELPNIMFLGEDQRHLFIEKIDAMQNLLYLIHMDAADPTQVIAHADQADRLLLEMQQQILPEAPPN